MKLKGFILNPSEVISDVNWRANLECYNSELVNAALAQKYNLNKRDRGIFDRLVIERHEVLVIKYFLGGLVGKTVLDLGCGSVSSPDANRSRFYTDRMYEPWLCRVLHELGVHAIGVDLRGLDSEPFESYEIDLSKQDSLRELPDNSVDLAFARALFDSPTLYETHGFWGGRILFDNLIPQLERIVKKEGFFLFGTEGTELPAQVMETGKKASQ